jgi:hypothetical protein
MSCILMVLCFFIPEENRAYAFKCHPPMPMATGLKCLHPSCNYCLSCIRADKFTLAKKGSALAYCHIIQGISRERFPQNHYRNPFFKNSQKRNKPKIFLIVRILNLNFKGFFLNKKDSK